MIKYLLTKLGQAMDLATFGLFAIITSQIFSHPALPLSQLVHIMS